MTDGDCQHYQCRCAQHGPIVGSVTFSGPGSGWEVPPDVHPGMAEHVRRAVDDYVATLSEVDDDAATVVELLQRGDSWHVSIRRGAMHYENAEPSLPAALEAVGRVLGQSVGSCAEVPTVRREEKRKRLAARVRAELLASLPPCQITDPEALAKLTPERVRAYLKGKGWSRCEWTSLQGREYWLSPRNEEGGCWSWMPGDQGEEPILHKLAAYESRSAAAVYLDILQTEPEGYTP